MLKPHWVCKSLFEIFLENFATFCYIIYFSGLIVKSIAIIGCGGHLRSALNLLKCSFYQSKLSIFDDTFEEHERIRHIEMIGKIKDIDKEYMVFLAVGNNIERSQLFYKFKSQLITENLFHSLSTVEKDVNFGIANQIYANSYINSETQIGNNNIINTGAIIEHEAIIGNHNHISVGTIICGRVTIGDNCMIGANSTIIDKISICSDVIIGAGSLVICNINIPGTYVGNPVRKVNC